MNGDFNFQKESQELLKESSQSLGKDATIFLNTILKKQLITKINIFLQELKNCSQVTSNDINKAYNYPSIAGIEDERKRQATARYIAAKQGIKNQYRFNELMKNGYKLIDLFREIFTGEKITYQIGVEYFGNVYEGSLTLDEILSRVQVVPNWGGTLNNLYKLRFTASRGDLVKSLLGIQLIYSKNISTEEKHHSLYSYIASYGASKKINKGNLYEVYRNLYYKYGGNTIPPAVWDQIEFLNTLEEVVKNNVSSVQGGDIFEAQEQDKFFGGTLPSLMTIYEMRETLKKIVFSLQASSEAEMKSQLTNLFFSQANSQEGSKKIEQSLKKISQEKIEELTKILSKF